MPRLLKKINDPANDTIALNENFDNVSLDLSDGRGVFSGDLETGGLVVPAGSRRTLEISILDLRNKYVGGQLPALLRYTMFVNIDGDGQYIWPLGDNITLTMVNDLRVEANQQKYTINPLENEKATMTMLIVNSGVVDYTVYLYLDVFYLPGPDLGVARRTG